MEVGRHGKLVDGVAGGGGHPPGITGGARGGNGRRRRQPGKPLPIRRSPLIDDEEGLTIERLGFRPVRCGCAELGESRSRLRKRSWGKSSFVHLSFPPGKDESERAKE